MREDQGKRRVLVLGGTTEGREIAQQLATHDELALWYALAGRTGTPRVEGIPAAYILSGGLGGVEGLAHFLASNAVDAVIDATHPFAANISRNALTAACAEDVAIARLDRPGWEERAGDRWYRVKSTAAAIDLVRKPPAQAGWQRVLLTIGSQDLPLWCDALGDPHTALTRNQSVVVARTIENPAATLPANFVSLCARGPFSLTAELALLRDSQIDVIVSKLSGGSSSYAKVLAARECQIPMVMIEPPALPATRSFSDVTDIVQWAVDGA